MILTETLSGHRLYLRPLVAADATTVYAGWLNDPEVNKYLATKSATIPELLAYINKKNEQSDAIFLAIVVAEGNHWIGTIKLEPIDWKAKRATIAIMIGEKSYWGQALGPEAMQTLMTYGFNELHLKEIELGVRAQNESALRAYQKIGFKEVKRELHAIQNGDVWYDQVTMICPNPNLPNT